MSDLTTRPLRAASPAWAVFFLVGYRVLRALAPIIRPVWQRGLLGITVELRMTGRRSGRPRPVLVGLLEVGGRSYVGHPNGQAGWTLNLAAAGRGTVVWPTGATRRVTASLLPDGEERDAAIVATAHQQPFPGNLFYRAARRHILAVGAYLRLEPEEDSDRSAAPGPDVQKSVSREKSRC